MRGTVEERFWAKVDTSGECWGWIAGKDSKGYGNFHVRPKVHVKSHRFSYELLVGPIAEGLVVDHMCHNPGCVNPEHLRAVTTKQNCENRLEVQVNNKSGFRGVSWDNRKQRWAAVIVHNWKHHYLGYYKTIEEATAAVVAKRLELFTHSDMDKAA